MTAHQNSITSDGTMYGKFKRGLHELKVKLRSLSDEYFTHESIPQEDRLHKTLNLYIVVEGIHETRLKSSRKTNPNLMDSTSAEPFNGSPLEQEVSTQEISRSFTQTTSVTKSTAREVGHVDQLELTAGISIGPVTLGGGASQARSRTTTRENSETTETTTEVTITAPSQKVKLGPKTKTRVTTNFYSYNVRQNLLIDFYIDKERSFIKRSSDTGGPTICNTFDSNFNDRIIGLLAEKRGAPGPDDVTIVKIGDDFILKNYPVQANVVGYETSSYFGGHTPI